MTLQEVLELHFEKHDNLTKEEYDDILWGLKDE